MMARQTEGSMQRFRSVSLVAIGILAGAAAASAQTAARGPQPAPACGPNLTIKNTDKQSRCFELRTYTVTLTVTDDRGRIDSTNKTISVAKPTALR